MNNLAEQLAIAQTTLEHGIVSKVLANDYWVRTDWGDLPCRRAAGCLLSPEQGDKVLVAVATAGPSYMISVLERAAETPPAVDLAPGTVIRSSQGDLALAAAGRLQCSSASLEVHAASADAAVDATRFTGRLFRVRLDSLHCVAERVETIAKDLTQRLGSMFRHTKGHEEIQVESSRQLVEETHTLQAKNAVVIAEEDVRLDGELIHMG